MLGSSTAGREALPPTAMRLLPDGWEAAGVLDLDRAATGITQEQGPADPTDGFDLIWGSTAFDRTQGWAELLLNVHRQLSRDGRLIAGLRGAGDLEALTGENWDEDRIGMTVASGPDGESVAFHSEWWLRAHWGRAFELIEVAREGGGLWASLRRREPAPSADELRRPEPGEERELRAAAANVQLLVEQTAGASRRHRAELDALREELGRELMRKSFEAAHLEWATRGPDSPATELADAYEATLSWRVTRPLRAAGRALRRARGSRAG